MSCSTLDEVVWFTDLFMLILPQCVHWTRTMIACYVFLSPHYRGNKSRNLTDLAVLVLKYPSAPSHEETIPFPESCAIISSSQIQSIVTTSGLLDPGKYAILPLAFNHWLHHSQDTKQNTESKRRPSENVGEAKSFPYVVALHTGRLVACHEHVTTRPGFLTESLFLLMKTKGKKTSVSVMVWLAQFHCCHQCNATVGIPSKCTCKG